MAVPNLQNAAGVIISLVKQAEISFKDGAQVSDIFAFMGQFAGISAVLQNKEALVTEWKNKTNADIQELLAYIDTNLAIQNKAIEAKIKAAIAALIADISLLELFISKPAVTPAAVTT